VLGGWNLQVDALPSRPSPLRKQGSSLKLHITSPNLVCIAFCSFMDPQLQLTFPRPKNLDPSFRWDAGVLGDECFGMSRNSN
jgi:hypothetical protein